MNQRVFVDTSGYFAFAYDRDQHFSEARLTMQQLAASGADLYTTNFVAAELHALLVNRVNREIARQFLDRLYAGTTHIIRVTEPDEQRARDLLHQHSDKDYSLVDALSFVVMQRLHIRSAWAYDHHFSQFGFSLAVQ